MKKPLAEFIGTFTLVLLGCGAAVIAGDLIGFAGISFAFGLALIGMAYGIGSVSGCHINPAVTLGVVAAGRMSFADANTLHDRASGRCHCCRSCFNHDRDRSGRRA